MREAPWRSLTLTLTLTLTLFMACGRLPGEVDLAKVMVLLERPDFTGCPDQYDDGKGTLLPYCVGPVNVDSWGLVKLLIALGADPTFRNNRGQTALAYVKAWAPRHQALAQLLCRFGCDPEEPAAFETGGLEPALPEDVRQQLSWLESQDEVNQHHAWVSNGPEARPP